MKVGILAAGGPFPLRVAEAAAAAGHEVSVVCIKDFCAPADFASFECYESRLGAGGAILDWLRERGVRNLVLAGRARRPSVVSLWPDVWTANALAKIGSAAFSGDDRFLRAALKILTDEGFEILPPESFLDESLASVGLLAGPEPDSTAHRDIERGVRILLSLGPLDIGQAVVVQQGLVLGIEAIEGTDALIERAGELARDGQGGVLVKISKVGQDLRVDTPVIGPQTVEAAARAGLRGIAIEAHRTLLADRTELLKAANLYKLFIIAVDAMATKNKM